MDGKFVNELHVQPRLRFDMRNKGVNASRPAFGVPARFLRIGESLVRQPKLSSISLFQEHNRNEGFTDVRLRLESFRKVMKCTIVNASNAIMTNDGPGRGQEIFKSLKNRFEARIPRVVDAACPLHPQKLGKIGAMVRITCVIQQYRIHQYLRRRKGSGVYFSA